MPRASKFFAGSRPRVFGHKGSAGTTPENTIVSLDQGVADGADVLEFDVCLTKDKRLVVCHDPTVDRTTNGTGRIADLTLAQIKELDAGYHFQPAGSTDHPFRGQGITIPTLDDVLERFPHILLDIELKGDAPETAPIFLALLKRFDRMDDGSIICSSFSHKLLRAVRKLAPQLATSYSQRENIAWVVLTKLHLRTLRPRRAPARVLQLPFKRNRMTIVTPQLVKLAHALDLEVHVWTVNDESDMRRLLAMGVDGIFSDYPERLRRIVDAFRRT
jgi:glycerophosphoryl diester phosphodiesterase